MMKRATTVLFVLGVFLLLASVASAGDEERSVVVQGKVACAKCTLKLEGATECQDVLVVKGKDGGDPTYYYLVKNDVLEKFGHTCQGSKMASVTGTIMEKDGKTWLDATSMEPVEKG